MAEALTTVPGIREVNVYGVTVPGADGRAGMAALVVDGTFDVAGLAKRLEGHLSPFARPCFLRLQPEIEVTGTFKQRKVELVTEGFDPGKIADPLYWYDHGPALREAYRGDLRRHHQRSHQALGEIFRQCRARLFAQDRHMAVIAMADADHHAFGLEARDLILGELEAQPMHG